ncbi:hypothetical protein [Actinoplanes couchii]|uniref:Berberine/berberine-like domain-containing protein n=1 Tax=Actinoplanes couchii TaxID=403638 RepID=A0ABQ3XQS4_9ACTN|nr:hypothetical protein [Actinoplanes couchii]MDR6318821.1 hypothetical protein [Actinoplanes couchii]GID60852.1 hypothetical protein Aco03nite_092560 [Actinoplanes couchii]
MPQDGFAHIDTAADALADWNGRAAREFKTNYLDPAGSCGRKGWNG